MSTMAIKQKGIEIKEKLNTKTAEAKEKLGNKTAAVKEKLNAKTVVVKEKVQANSSKIIAITGAVMAIGSAAMIIDYAVRKHKSEANVVELVAGIAGVIIGASLAAEPAVKKVYKRKKEVADVPEAEEEAAPDEEAGEVTAEIETVEDATV